MINENTLIIINILTAGSIIMPLSLGFSLTMRTLRFADFALGGYALLAAWFFYFYSTFGYGFYFSFLVSIASAALLAVFFDFAFYRKIRKKNTAGTPLPAITSFATFVMLREVFVFLYPVPYMPAAPPFMIFISWFSFILLFFMLKKTRIGKAIRALSKNNNSAELAEISGIDTQRLISAGMIIAGCFAGISGILTNFESGINADVGSMLLIKAFAASILISEGIGGAAVGSLLMGALETFLTSPYKEIAIFAMIISVLLIKSKIKSKDGYGHESA